MESNKRLCLKVAKQNHFVTCNCRHEGVEDSEGPRARHRQDVGVALEHGDHCKHEVSLSVSGCLWSVCTYLDVLHQQSFLTAL